MAPFELVFGPVFMLVSELREIDLDMGVYGNADVVSLDRTSNACENHIQAPKALNNSAL